MNAAHKAKLADRQAKRFDEACRQVAQTRATFGKDHELTTAARKRRNGIGRKLYELDGNWDRHDLIMEKHTIGELEKELGK